MSRGGPARWKSGVDPRACASECTSSKQPSIPMVCHGPRTGIPPTVMAPRHGFVVAALAAGIALGASSCSVEPAPGGDWPPGTLVIARSTALRQLLAQLRQLEGTPLARKAAAVAATLPDCEWLEGRSEGDPAEALSHLACRSGAGELSGLDRERGDRDIAFALPAHRGRRIIGTLDVSDAGDVVAELMLPRSVFTSARALLLPSDGAPGPSRLSHVDELVHARLKPEGGLDIAALVPPDGQADQMFRLKSELFAGAVLDGTWEIAVYLPEPGQAMPPAALAIGFSLKRAAVAAMEDFVSEIEGTWPVRRSRFALGDAAGACLLDLKLLPDLAPCYVATDDALVVGWNPPSLRKALAGPTMPAAEAAPPHPDTGLSIDFSLFPEADARFAQQGGTDSPRRGSGVYPWRRLVADGSPDGDGVRLRLRLDAGAGV